MVLLLVYLIRFILHKSPVMVLFMVGLIPWAESLQIHPGVLLITIVMGIECWFLPLPDRLVFDRLFKHRGKCFSPCARKESDVVKVLGIIPGSARELSLLESIGAHALSSSLPTI